MELTKVTDIVRNADCLISLSEIVAITPVPPEANKPFKSVICLASDVQIYCADTVQQTLDKLNSATKITTDSKLIQITDDLRDLEVVINSDAIIALVTDPNEAQTFKSIICLKENTEVCSKLSQEEILEHIDGNLYTQFKEIID